MAACGWPTELRRWTSRSLVPLMPLPLLLRWSQPALLVRTLLLGLSMLLLLLLLLALLLLLLLLLLLGPSVPRQR